MSIIAKQCDQRLSASSYLSVRPHGTIRLPLDRFSWNLSGAGGVVLNRSDNFWVSSKYDNNSTLHENLCIFMSISGQIRRQILLFFYVLLTVNPNIIMVFFFTNLMHKFFILIHLLHSSTCFEHYCAHLLEDNCINTASGIVTLETIFW